MMPTDPARRRHLDDLRRARVAARLSLRDVAKAIGVTHLEFANYERGVGSLAEDKIEAYFALLGRGQDEARPTPGDPMTTPADPQSSPPPAPVGMEERQARDAILDAVEALYAVRRPLDDCGGSPEEWQKVDAAQDVLLAAISRALAARDERIAKLEVLVDQAHASVAGEIAWRLATDRQTPMDAGMRLVELEAEVKRRREGDGFIDALVCGLEECSRRDTLTTATIAGAVHYAERTGWVLSEDGVVECDVCPDCAAKMHGARTLADAAAGKVGA